MEMGELEAGNKLTRGAARWAEGRCSQEMPEILENRIG